MWQNGNKLGTTGSIDLVNYSELHHPLSHHNVATCNSVQHTFPTELVGTRANTKLVKHGFYAKEALKVTNSLGKTATDYEEFDKQPKQLDQFDPRIEKHPDMLATSNNTAPVNRELIEDIEYSNQVRAYQRGLSNFCPEPREKYAYEPPEESKRQLDFMV